MTLLVDRHRLRERSRGLDDLVSIKINDVSNVKLLLTVDVCCQWPIANFLKSGLVLSLAWLTKQIFVSRWF